MQEGRGEVNYRIRCSEAGSSILLIKPKINHEKSNHSKAFELKRKAEECRKSVNSYY
jgi:hypothetical protein